MLQDIIIATKSRAKMEGLAQVLKQEAFAIAKKVSTETTAKVSTIYPCLHILIIRVNCTLKHSVNIKTKWTKKLVL